MENKNFNYNPSFGLLSISELMSVSTKKTNRCGELSREKALSNDYSQKDWDAYIARATKLAKNIALNGYCQMSVFQIAESVTGEQYLIDGQGRRMALKICSEMSSEGIKVPLPSQVPCLIYKGVPEDEIDKAIFILNTGGKNWLNRDILRSKAIGEGGEAKKLYDKIESYKQSFKGGIEPCDYMARYIFLGERGSHLRSFNNPDLEITTFSEEWAKAYKYFVEGSSWVSVDNNEFKLRKKDTVKKICSQDFCIGIIQIFKSIEKYISDEYYRKYGCTDDVVEKMRPEIESAFLDFADRLIEHCNTLSDEALSREIKSLKVLGLNGKINAETVWRHFLHYNSNNSFVNKYCSKNVA